MAQVTKRRWIPRYSLKTFLLFCVVVGSGTVWVAHSYHEYLSEQKLIRPPVKAPFLLLQAST